MRREQIESNIRVAESIRADSPVLSELAVTHGREALEQAVRAEKAERERDELAKLVTKETGLSVEWEADDE